MKKLLLMTFFVLLASAIGAQTPDNDKPNTCLDCHQTLGPPYDSLAVAQSKDVHGSNGIQCVDCHGGDPTSMDYEKAMSPAAGFKGKPDHTEIPELCGSCHSNPDYMKKYNPAIPVDQLSKYWTSKHGEQLKKGDKKVAECASCHNAHGILPVNDPRAPVYATNVPATCSKCHSDKKYMADYNIPTDQYELFKKSVHGKDLLVNKDTGAPACNDCHGNHGATPPGITSISRVCGTCHVNNFNLFKASVHKPIFDQMDLPECETCHGNHDVEHPTDAFIGTGPQSKCMMCHAEGDTGYKVAASMKASIDSLRSVYDSAQVMIKAAEQKDMNVEDLQFSLRDVRQQLILTRTTIHSFDKDKVKVAEEKGLTKGEKIVAAAKGLIHEYYYRRRGLGAFTLIITLLVIVLFFKIRQIEKK